MANSLVFISYSHKDEEWKDRLVTQLGALPDLGELRVWDDRRIAGGDDWHQSIVNTIDEAKIAILLISAPFLTSRFISEEEIPRLRARSAQSGLRIFPILVWPCPWQRYPWLAALQLRPKDAKALSGGTEHQIQENLAAIAGEIADLLAVPAPAAAAIPTRDPEVAPPTPSPASSEVEVIAHGSHVTGEAVRTVANLIRDDDVRAIVQRFNAEFAEVSGVVEALTNYKELHDELHQIEFYCYRGLLTESRRPTAEAINWDALVEYEMTLQASINQLNALADRAQLHAQETSWIGRLVEAHDHLTAAIEQHEPKRLRMAASALERVLTVEPSRLNDRMTAATRELDLSPLEQPLEFVRRRLATTQLDPAALEQVRAGLQSLDGLGQAVSTLVQDHDRWQNLEFSLRRLESSLAGGIAEIEYSWPDVSGQADALYGNNQDPWAEGLKANQEQVQNALASDAPNRAEQVTLRFRRFRRQAGDQFFRVDSNLRDACAKLGKVAEPLLLLLRLVEGT